MPNYENELKEDTELMTASQKESPIYYPKIIGQFSAGSSEDYGNPRLRDVLVAPGENIQDAVDGLGARGGGVVRLLRGTHLVSEDIKVPSRTSLEGEGIDSTIIDFSGQAFAIRIEAEVKTTAGTITASEGSVTVTGSSTAFTSAVPGDYLYMAASDAHSIFKISSIASDTSLTLVDVWPTPTLATTLSDLRSVVENPSLKNFTVRNGNHADGNISIIGVLNLRIENVRSYNSSSSHGISMSVVFDSEIINCEASYNGNGTADNGYNCGKVRRTVFQSCSSVGNAGDGFEFSADSSDISLYSCIAEGNTADGFEMNSDRLRLYGCRSFGNDAVGFDFPSLVDNVVIESCSAIDNVEDGIQIDGDDCSILNCVLRNNDAYGIDITANANRIFLAGNFFSGNTSGTIRDAGSGTHYANQGAGTFTAANGANNNIDIGEQVYTRISGPTLAYSISGITNTANAKMVTLFNTTTQDMTLTNQATSDDTQQLLTLTGADVTLTGTSLARFQYDATSKKWVLLGTQG